MSKVGKILLALIILISSVISNFIGIGTKVEASTFFVDEVELIEKNVITDTITYNGEEIVTTFVYYLKDGVEYPAYCISPGADGVGEYGSYTVTVDSLLNDTNIWRVITNGYPYKSASELGCANANEAFAATKQAVYCAIYGRDASWYGSLGASGDRVINAMANILSAANSSSNGKPSGNIEITDESGEWTIDNTLKNYISKTFSISASTTYDTYNVSVLGNMPEGVTILNMSNTPKKTFISGEKFKIAIPTSTLNNNGSFKVNVQAKLKTKPVLFGRAPAGTGLQNYALTAAVYEEAEGSKTLNYTKNDTKIEILKQDEKTSLPLKGVEFRILDKNKKPVYTDLVTNANGKIQVTGLLPGKYYLEEVKGLDGYTKYDELIPFDIEYNQVLTITVNNSPEKTKEISTDVKNINVKQKEESIVVKTKNENVNITNNKQNESIELELKKTDVNQEQKDEYVAVENKNINIDNDKQSESIKIENENTNINKNKQDEKIEIDNKNTNINKNEKNTEVKITNDNKNQNINKSNDKLDTKNNSENTNVNVKNSKANQSEKNETINKNANIKQENITENIKTINYNLNQNSNDKDQEINIVNNNQNINTNIQSLNGIVKLPKTGM